MASELGKVSPASAVLAERFASPIIAYSLGGDRVSIIAYY